MAHRRIIYTPESSCPSTRTLLLDRLCQRFNGRRRRPTRVVYYTRFRRRRRRRGCCVRRVDRLGRGANKKRRTRCQIPRTRRASCCRRRLFSPPPNDDARADERTKKREFYPRYDRPAVPPKSSDQAASLPSWVREREKRRRRPHDSFIRSKSKNT